jgi:hypothetical protein
MCIRDIAISVKCAVANISTFLGVADTAHLGGAADRFPK